MDFNDPEIPDLIKDIVREEIGDQQVFDLLTSDEVGEYYYWMMKSKKSCKKIIEEFTGSYALNNPDLEISENLQLFKEGKIDELSDRLASIAKSIPKDSRREADNLISARYESINQQSNAERVIKNVCKRNAIPTEYTFNSDEIHEPRKNMWRISSFNFEICNRLANILDPKPYIPQDPRDVEET